MTIGVVGERDVRLLGRGLVKSPGIWLLAFVLMWAFVNAVANSANGLNHDMIESYVWGHEFQLGYYKHPPFWAWVAGLWFHVFPTNGSSFAVLSAINAGLGLLGCWYLVGCFTSGNKRLAAVALLLASPFYTLFAYKYNANTIFLSIWPWTAYFFLRSMQSRAPVDAVLLGILAGIAALSKYYAIVLLFSCLVASILHSQRRAYFRSASPYLSVASCGAVIAPHVGWLIVNGFQPFHYFEGETGHGLAFVAHQTIDLFAQYLLPQIVIVLVVLFGGGARFSSRLGHLARENRVLLVLACGPFVLTVFLSVLFRVLITSNTALSTFCLAPLALIELTEGGNIARMKRAALALAAASTVVALLAAPVLAYAHAVGLMRGTPGINDPSEELAGAATTMWHATMRSPVAFVAGTQLYADSIVFYSPDHPSELIDFDHEKSPWVSKAALLRGGLLIACLASDQKCLLQAAAQTGGRTLTERISLQHKAFGQSGRMVEFVLFLVAPEPAVVGRGI
jgi:4-amino-4-deoxy-L-arabinose transferase-like glycosyltransferase